MYDDNTGEYSPSDFAVQPDAAPPAVVPQPEANQPPAGQPDFAVQPPTGEQPDWAAYTNASADLTKAASDLNLDAATFGAQHYAQYGQAEGRPPPPSFAVFGDNAPANNAPAGNDFNVYGAPGDTSGGGSTYDFAVNSAASSVEEQGPTSSVGPDGQVAYKDATGKPITKEQYEAQITAGTTRTEAPDLAVKDTPATSGVDYLTGADFSYIPPPPPTEGANEGTYDNEGNYIPPYNNPYAGGLLKIGDKNIAAAGLESGGGFNGSYYAARTNTGDLAAAVMASDGQGVRLVDGSGKVIYEGTGSNGARDVASLANYISTSDGKNAAWNIQIEDPNNKGTYNSAGYESADKVKNKFDVGGFLVDVIAPMALFAIPGIGPMLGSALMSAGGAIAAGLGLSGAVGAAIPLMLKAGAGAIASGLIQGKSVTDITKSTLLTMATAGALKVIPGGSIVSNTVGKVTTPINKAITGTLNNVVDKAGEAFGKEALSSTLNSAGSTFGANLGAKTGEALVNTLGTVSKIIVSPLSGTVNATANLVNAGSNLIHRPTTPSTPFVPADVKLTTPQIGGPVRPLLTEGPLEEVVVSPTTVVTPTISPPPGATTVSEAEVKATRTNPVVVGTNFTPATVGPNGETVVDKVELEATKKEQPAVTSDTKLTTTEPPNVVEKVEPTFVRPTTPVIPPPPPPVTPVTRDVVVPPDVRPVLPPVPPEPPIVVIPSDTKPKTTTTPGGITLDDLRVQLGKNFRAKLPKSRMQLGQRQVNLTPEQWRQYALHPRGGLQRGGEEAFFNYAVEPLMKPVAAARGGAINDFAVAAARGGRNFAVNGPGTGRSDSIPAKLSDGEYVMDAETVALLGDGSSKAGAQRLDQMRVNIRKHKGQNLAKGRFSVNARAPERYMSGGRS